MKPTWMDAVKSLMVVYDGSVIGTRDRDIKVAKELIRLLKEWVNA